MLKKISLQNIGPISNFDIEPGRRLNVITGDNGLGKSFILDIIWFALTRCWPASVNKKLTSGYMAKPFVPGRPASIAFDLITDQRKNIIKEMTFDLSQQTWKIPASRPPIPGVVIYAHIDGSFSVWDPNKNYWSHVKNENEEDDTPPAFVFSPQDVWYGLNNADESVRYCNGMLQDLYDWQKDADWKIQVFNRVLKQLSPPDFQLSIGEPVKLSVKDVRKIPTVHMPYGDISILIAAAGIKRVFALAYFITWTLLEHKENSLLIGKKPTNQITFLMDEIEAHLHPKWQRRIVGCLLDAFGDSKIVEGLGYAPDIQMFLATHSALIMASIEPRFDSSVDKWFDINALGDSVVITDEEFTRMGNADAWLTSGAFDLKSTQSIEAEEAIREYNAATDLTGSSKKELIEKLEKVLPDTDPFWRIIDFQKSMEDKQ